MNTIRAGIINENVKLFKRSKYKAMLISISGAIIIIGLMNNLMEGYINVLISNLPLNILTALNAIFIPLVIFIAVSDLFTGEQENGTIKAVIIRPIKRKEIIISKIISILIYVMSILSIAFIISTIIGIAYGKTRIVNIPDIFVSYVVSILPIIPTILFSIFISQLSKSSFVSVMISVLIYIIIILLGAMFPSVSLVMFTTYVNCYRLFVGASVPVGSIFEIIGLFSGYCFIFFSAACALFENREY